MLGEDAVLWNVEEKRSVSEVVYCFVTGSRDDESELI